MPLGAGEKEAVPVAESFGRFCKRLETQFFGASWRGTGWKYEWLYFRCGAVLFLFLYTYFCISVAVRAYTLCLVAIWDLNRSRCDQVPLRCTRYMWAVLFKTLRFRTSSKNSNYNVRPAAFGELSSTTSFSSKVLQILRRALANANSLRKKSSPPASIPWQPLGLSV